ncbi:uncharacterized protein MCYG_04985 [Microsporum canis CBS 113480]|uniref:Uncharacterized protein n=1 Tax=Arthroderma otae (strain ATCC MYA-4605 / CBS 113480) TaxID=554155 RepID=C5FQL3_ARTOC|nr:uncharacterized protein MCYG_04985 [Microsporum canis CBS 113480]EEQ32166.1 predicted protein [Microsporum canis CBS 113480]
MWRERSISPLYQRRIPLNHIRQGHLIIYLDDRIYITSLDKWNLLQFVTMPLYIGVSVWMPFGDLVGVIVAVGFGIYPMTDTQAGTGIARLDQMELVTVVNNLGLRWQGVHNGLAGVGWEAERAVVYGLVTAGGRAIVVRIHGVVPRWWKGESGGTPNNYKPRVD